MSVRVSLVLLLLLLGSTACASTGSSSGGPVYGAITAGDFVDMSASNAYEAVQQLRPQWLRVRGRASINRPGGIVVYRDGIRAGGLGALRRISVQVIESIRFLDGSDATLRFGTGHDNGAILVVTR